MHFDKISDTQLQMVMLEKAKVGAHGILSPQAAADLTVSVLDYDPILKEKVIELSTYMYRHKIGDDTRHVRVAKRVDLNDINRKLFFSLIGLFGFGAAITLAVNSLFVASILLLGFLYLFMFVGLATSPETVVVDEWVEIPVQQYNAFPDNKKIYPESMGAPIVQVVTGPPKLVEDLEKRRELENDPRV